MKIALEHYFSIPGTRKCQKLLLQFYKLIVLEINETVLLVLVWTKKRFCHTGVIYLKVIFRTVQFEDTSPNAGVCCVGFWKACHWLWRKLLFLFDKGKFRMHTTVDFLARVKQNPFVHFSLQFSILFKISKSVVHEWKLQNSDANVDLRKSFKS